MASLEEGMYSYLDLECMQTESIEIVYLYKNLCFTIIYITGAQQAVQQCQRGAEQTDHLAGEQSFCGRSQCSS